MQHLMEHMRQHHKPNTYFLCQSCRSKLRSYRALLKHLHTCAKVAKSKAKAGEQAEVKPDPDPDAAVPMGTDQETPQQQEPMESEPSHPVHGPTGSDHLSAQAPYQPPEDGSLSAWTSTRPCSLEPSPSRREVVGDCQTPSPQASQTSALTDPMAPSHSTFNLHWKFLDRRHNSRGPPGPSLRLYLPPRPPRPPPRPAPTLAGGRTKTLRGL
uniref:zinc finger protein 414-like n=1 Tax=Oncorhynchus gorbuscha TaxID=8017 RepID=UPI001EAF7D1B|nr:zinc finger protein 414-like [Oncorhynchus gorbuscha]